MPMTRTNTKVFHRRLYAGELRTITLLKRGIDQQEGTVVSYKLFQCYRQWITKSGQPIQNDMTVSHRTLWMIPKTEMDRVGISDINVLDRIVAKSDETNRLEYWEPESGQSIGLHQFGNFVKIQCVRIDPTPNP